MAHVILSTVIPDSDAPMKLILEPGSDLEAMPKRVTRTATLDGGQYIDDRGYFPADRELSIRTRLDRAGNARLERLILNHSIFTLSTPFGLFVGAIGGVTGTGGRRAFRFLPVAAGGVPESVLVYRPSLAMPAGAPDQSIIPAYPGVDWASNDIHNCWISGQYSWNVENPMYTSGLWEKKWYAAGWGRLLATENYDADWGQWFPNNSYTWFPAPAGTFTFATLGFTKDYIEGLDPVPVRVKVAHWGSYDETNGIAESFGADDRWPPPETIVYEGNGFIPVIPDTGEGHITDASGNPVNLAAALPAAGGVVCVALECTDLSYEYYRDFAELYLHLWL